MHTKGRWAQDTKIECVRNILDLQYYPGQRKGNVKQLRYLCSTSTVSNGVIPWSIAITSDQARKKVTFRFWPVFIRSCEHDITKWVSSAPELYEYLGFLNFIGQDVQCEQKVHKDNVAYQCRVVQDGYCILGRCLRVILKLLGIL